jgi:hypothetical protein
MLTIRKFGWSLLLLSAFIGCAKEEPETASTSTPSETAPASGTTATDTKPEAEKGSTATGDMPKAPPTIEAPLATPATKDDKASAVSLTADEIAEIKKLPTSDAEQALQQLVCPVSGEHLGAMGVPLKVTAADQTFYLCCKGCSKEVKDNPAAVVAKLKK